MTQEEKQLLINDLCGRLSYGVMVRTSISAKPLTCEILSHIINGTNNFNILPYLRPMSSMTEEEAEEYNDLVNELSDYDCKPEQSASKMIDWLNKKMFDYRGLIPMGLALETTKDMYKKD